VKKSLTAVLPILLVVGCQRAPAQTSAASAAPAPQTAAPAQPAAGPAAGPKPVPAELPDVLARVDGEPISRAEFERAVKNIEGRAGGPIPAERRDEIFRDILDQLVAYRALVQESRARKVTVTEPEVEARIDAIRKQFPDEGAFDKALAERGLSLDRLRADTREEMLVAKLVESEVKPQIDVTESDIKAFYDQNPERFQQPEQVRASHILIRLAEGGSEEQKKAARAKAEDVLAKVKAGGDFAALARQHSQDGSAQQGGDLNFFQRGQMVPPFEEAAFALQPGQVSGIVESPFGFHIIKVTERRPARTVPLAEAAPRIGQFLTMQRQQEKTEAFINAVKARHKIEILI
jgi:peptidyl-prolyl cis-trans isomerase C